jgi:hypothetical protein
MSCPDLATLLKTTNTDTTSLSAHITTCPACQEGLWKLAQELLQQDEQPTPISCSTCLSRLPELYEATQPDYPLVHMEEHTLVETANHLLTCNTCRQLYTQLQATSTAEESEPL